MTLEELAAEKGLLTKQSAQEVQEHCNEEHTETNAGGFDPFVEIGVTPAVDHEKTPGTAPAAEIKTKQRKKTKANTIFEDGLNALKDKALSNFESTSGLLQRVYQETLFELFEDCKTKEEADKVTAVFTELVINALGPLRDFYKSDEYKQLKEAFPDFDEWVKGTNQQRSLADILLFSQFIDEFKTLAPYLLEELQKLEEVTDGSAPHITTMREFMRNIDDAGEPKKSYFELLLDKAKLTRESAETLETFINNSAKLQALRPDAHTMPNNALMNALQEGVKHKDGTPPAAPINAGEFGLVVSQETKKRKEITALTMISYDSGETGVKITPTKLTEYERQVSDAIISLWQQAGTEHLPPIFTTDMIYRAMPGGGDKASPQQRGAITKTIEKLRKLHIFVDATDELRKRGKIKPNASFILDDYFFSMKRAEMKIKNGGQSVIAYQLNSEPIILSYARMTSQILTVPAKYIAVEKVKSGKASGEVVAMTADRQAMTGYILRQIAWIKYDREHKKPNPRSNVILFDTIFKDVGIETDNREVARRNRDFVFSVLDYEIAAGYISGYEKQTKGRAITGVIIKP